MVAIWPLPLGQFTHLKDAGCPALEFSNPGHPILNILWWNAFAVFGEVASGQLLGGGSDSADWPQEVLGEINAVNPHVAQLARSSHRLILPPANGAFAPILQ